MTLLLAYQNRNFTRDIQLFAADGVTVITPTASDLVKATIFREGSTAVFTVTSGTDSANGSTFTKGATCRLRIDAEDMTMPYGVYTLAIDYYDNADSQDWKTVERQCFVVEET